MKKISLRGISTPFGGLSWAPTDDKEERTINLAKAKAFEAGRLLMGTYMELQFDENYYFADKLERISGYLTDIGIKNTDLGFINSGMSYDAFQEGAQKINGQLWSKGGKLGHHFETAIHLFTAVVPGKEEQFNQLVGELNLPSRVVKKRKTSLENFAEIRKYFEEMIFS
jgi:hypothetical protein